MSGSVALALVGLLVLAVAPWVPVRPPSGARRSEASVFSRSRRERRDVPDEGVHLDAAVALDLAAVALAAGASVPRALDALGDALGEEGRSLRRAGSMLLLGARWADAWEDVPDRLRPLERALEPGWLDGVPAAALLQAAADQARANHSRLAEEAAARLGVRLVLPLGVCFLPAFVLLGLVPVLLATGGGLLGG